MNLPRMFWCKMQNKIEKVTRRAQEQIQMVLEEQSRCFLDLFSWNYFCCHSTLFTMHLMIWSTCFSLAYPTSVFWECIHKVDIDPTLLNVMWGKTVVLCKISNICRIVFRKNLILAKGVYKLVKILFMDIGVYLLLNL